MESPAPPPGMSSEGTPFCIVCEFAMTIIEKKVSIFEKKVSLEITS